jgi:hypothetical protein
VEEKYKFWRIWADHLQYWGLDEFAAGVLEAAGPFNLILAQLVYLGQPLLFFHDIPGWVSYIRGAFGRSG